VENLKKTQEELSKQIADLNEAIQEKKDARAARDPEMEALVKTTLRQNQKLEERIDTLLASLESASEDYSDEAMQRAVAALAKSQIESLQTIQELKKRIDAAEDIKQLQKAQEKGLAQIEQRISALSNVISQLPYSAQIDGLKQQLNSLADDVKTLESLVSSSPEEVLQSLGSLKDELDAARTKLVDLEGELGELGEKAEASRSEIKSEIRQAEEKEERGRVGLESEIKEVGDREEKGLQSIAEQEKMNKNEILAHLTAISTLQAKVTSIESNLDHLASMTAEGRVELSKDIAQKLSSVTEDLKALDYLKKEVDELARSRLGEKEKALKIIDSINLLQSEVRKLENWTEAYPIGDAQEMTFINERFNEVEDEIRGINQKDIQSSVMQQMQEIRDRFRGYEEEMRKQGVDVSERHDKELETIINTLKVMESKLRSVEKQSDFEKKLSNIHGSASELQKEIEALSIKQVRVEADTQKQREIREIRTRTNQTIAQMQEDRERLAKEYRAKDAELQDKLADAESRFMKAEERAKLQEQKAELTEQYRKEDRELLNKLAKAKSQPATIVIDRGEERVAPIASEDKKKIEEIKRRINTEIWKPLNDAEKYFEEGRIAERDKVSEMRENIGEARRIVEKRPEKIRPQALTNLRKKADEFHENLPTHAADTSKMSEIRESLETSADQFSRIARKTDVKELHKALNKAEDLQQVMKEHAQASKKMGKASEEIKRSAQQLESSGKDAMLAYLRTLPWGEEYPLHILESRLKLSNDQVKRLIMQVNVESPGYLELVDFSYMSKLLGKEPRVKKLKEM